MKKIYQYWTNLNNNKDGYSVADITYHAAGSEDEFYGKDRKTLNAAINDAIRFWSKHQDSLVDIFATATLTDYYEGGDAPIRKPEEDCVMIGTIHDGEYVDMCQQVEWL